MPVPPRGSAFRAPGAQPESRRRRPSERDRRARSRLTSAWRATAATTSASDVRRWSSTLVETWATPRWSSHRPIARTHGQPLRPALPDQGGDSLRVEQRGGRGELDVEGHQRRPCRHQHRAAASMEAGAGRSPASARRPAMRAAKLGGTAAAKLRAGSSAAQRSVQEHRQPQALHRADRRARAPLRTPRPGRPPRDRRSARRRSHPRAGGCPRGRPRRCAPAPPWLPRSTAGASVPGATGQREHAAVVVGITMDVEQLAAERRRDRVDRRVVATLGDVGNRQQGQAGSAGVASTQRPASSTRCPSISNVASVHHDIEVDRHRDRAADASAGAEGDVHGPEDLLVLQHVARELGPVVGSNSELGQVEAPVPVRPQQLDELRPEASTCVDQTAVLDGQQGRLVAQPEGCEARGRPAARCRQWGR